MKSLGSFFALVVVILGLVAGVVILFPDDHAEIERQTRQAQAEAERARAQTSLEQVRLDITEARADLEVAQGERAVLEAAAGAIRSDTELTEYYAHRGDMRGVLFVIAVLGLIGCGIVFEIIKWRGRNEPGSNDA